MDKYVIENDSITFSDSFNEPLTKETLDLIKKCKKVIFGKYFNQTVNDLPEGIDHLKLGYHFNKKLDGLPSTLKELMLDMNFNYPLDFLPVGLTHLTIGCNYATKYEHSLDNLPNTLTHLILNLCECHKRLSNPIKNLPHSLSHLEISGSHTFTICKENGETLLPPNLRYLKINANIVRFANLPSGLTTLIFVDSFSINERLYAENLPEGLEHVQFWRNFKQPLIDEVSGALFLPRNLKSVKFGMYFDNPLSSSDGRSYIPSGLTHLTLGFYFNRPILPGILPETLTHLSFSAHFNNELNEMNLPSGLKYLRLGNYFQGFIPKSAIHNLTHLEFILGFNGEFEDIPDSLIELKVGEEIFTGSEIQEQLHLFKTNGHTNKRFCIATIN